MSSIDDATGTGKQARVGNENRLHTHSLAASLEQVAAQKGAVFNVATDVITLTSANESAVLYFKNNEDEDVSVIKEFLNIGSSTGGVGNGVIRFYLGALTGTIVSTATDANVLNRRINDTASLTADSFQGVEGNTIVGTSVIIIPFTGGGTLPSEFVVPKGSTLTITYEPPTSNTSIDITVGMLVVKNYPTYTVE
jgi:hypothetical protein